MAGVGRGCMGPTHLVSGISGQALPGHCSCPQPCSPPLMVGRVEVLARVAPTGAHGFLPRPRGNPLPQGFPLMTPKQQFPNTPNLPQLNPHSDLLAGPSSPTAIGHDFSSSPTYAHSTKQSSLPVPLHGNHCQSSQSPMRGDTVS